MARDGGHDLVGEKAPKLSRRRRLRRRIISVATLAACAAVGIILVLSTVGGWAPLLHYTCSEETGSTETTYAWLPALIINSPHGGEAWGNATVPPGPLSPSGLGTVVEIGAANGSAVWAGFRAEINVSRVQNQTEWGPGQDTRCAEPVSVSVQYWGGVVLGAPILGAGNVTDDREPTTLGHWTYPGDINLTTANGYSADNAGNISTCGKGALSSFVETSRFELRIPLMCSLAHYSLLYPLPIHEALHHLFPSNLGTWQVDNLSAPGDPGSGRAFSFSPLSLAEPL
jgi:hypothetical protein